MTAYINDLTYGITHSSEDPLHKDFMKISTPFHLCYNSMVTSDHIYLKNYISDVNTVNILMLSTGAAI
jgi:hypothetical protein